jgi:hypothetical protein
MKIVSYKAAAAVMGAGLIVGTLAGAAPVAGASTLPILSTTTAVSYTPNELPDGGFNSITVTATVSLELVKGLLVTPSGVVTFTDTVEGGNGPITVPAGSATLSKCLLGLPSLLGITQATCSASVVVTVDQMYCGSNVFTGTYSAATDLVAKPSFGTTTFFLGC